MSAVCRQNVFGFIKLSLDSIHVASSSCIRLHLCFVAWTRVPENKLEYGS